jgi:peptide/nickel transport system substrate-binding protein
MARKRLIGLALMLILILILGASLAQAQQEKPKAGGTLVYATGTDALTLDPQFVTDVPTSRAVMQIHETLVKYDQNMNITPWLAESWTTSADRLTWTFKLRKGVKFQDGTPFNADAVKYTFDRIVDPAIASPRKSTVVMVKEVKVVDEYTVAITTNKPFAPLLAQLTAYNISIISPTAARKWEKKYAQNPSGTGPFKLESWTPGERIVFARNENYWAEKPYVDKVIFRVVPEDSTRVMLLLSGEADVIASVPPVLTEKLKQSKDVKILRKMGFRTIYIGMNNKIKPFTDVRVRRAVAHAINPESIVNGILNGMANIGGSFESPVIPGAIQGLKPYSYDPALAKKMLAEAGYPNGFTTQFYTPTGRYLMDRQVAEAVQGQLKEVGIQAEIKTPDWGTYTALLDKGTEVPIFLLGKGSPTGDLDLTLNLTIKTGGMMNQFQFSNIKADEMIKEQEGIIDMKKRYQVLYDIQKIVYDEVPAVVLFYEDQIFGSRANVEGVIVYPYEFIEFAKAWKK